MARDLATCLPATAAGVPGTTDQLRVRAYLDALLGQDTAARYQAAQAAPATEPGASPAGEVTQPSESPRNGNSQAQDSGSQDACNAGPRCRHHHHQKQHPSWRLDQHQAGIRTWTTPAGRRYSTGPTTYPV